MRGAPDPVREHVGRVQVPGVRVLAAPAPARARARAPARARARAAEPPPEAPGAARRARPGMEPPAARP